jgi:ABC-type lipoprotein export system ATPase subunit/ABC-type antimicrobial peptide transport system permease subunit
MIRLNKLHKYYNRKKQNEIHVLNDINITLPNKGLVVLLGPSGSGKTTLLNVLGGLDKVQSGLIEFNDQPIEKYKATTWDKIRNKEVGYIFQNYNLLKNLTVYDNISFTLNMLGIYDKAEIDKRVDYILDSMGMINYRKRKASQLSGGQQQRVAIARALAKNPSVIIADEPTGNLDSKNTQDIMHIIKSISVNKLVVLVTHEENLAEQYGDRIIRLKDGEIVSDIEHSATGAMNVKHETDIYLKDLHKVSELADENVKLASYTDELIDDKVNVRLIVKNKTLYIDLQSNEYKKINLIESDSEINIYNRHFESEETEEFKPSDFDLEGIITKQRSYEKHSVISIKDSIKLTFKRLRGVSRLGKLFYLGFGAGAVLIALAVGMISGVLNMDPTNFVTDPVETVEFYRDDLTYEEIMAFEDLTHVGYVQFIDTARIDVILPTIYQAYETTVDISTTPINKDYLDNDDIIQGRNVEAHNEFVISKVDADRLLMQNSVNYLGISNYDDLMSINYRVSIANTNYDLTLVGISDNFNKAVYLTEEVIYMIGGNIGIYDIFEDDVTLATGTALTDGSVWLVDSAINQTQTEFGLFTNNIPVSGTFETEATVPPVLGSIETVRKAYFDRYFVNPYARVSIFSNEVEETVDYFTSFDYEPYSTYAKALENYRENRLSDSLNVIIFTGVVLGASAISYFFIIRSSLLSRIYEISVYRALGVSKGDIRKIFITEIAFITTITSMVGYLLTTLVLWRIQILAEDFMDLIYISPLSIIGGTILIYLVNTVSGLIPVTNLLRRTPAEILSKYDF